MLLLVVLVKVHNGLIVIVKLHFNSILLLMSSGDTFYFFILTNIVIKFIFLGAYGCENSNEGSEELWSHCEFIYIPTEDASQRL